MCLNKFQSDSFHYLIGRMFLLEIGGKGEEHVVVGTQGAFEMKSVSFNVPGVTHYSLN